MNMGRGAARSRPGFVAGPSASGRWAAAPGTSAGRTGGPQAGRYRVRRALLLAGLIFSVQGTAMAKMVIFSPINGKVLLNGSPVAGAMVEREWKWAWKDETGNDRATTAADGQFALPLVERGSLLGSFLPHTPSVRQTILIKHEGKTYKAWMFDKEDYKLNGELQGKPIRVTCRLETQPARRGEIFGICEPE